MKPIPNNLEAFLQFDDIVSVDESIRSKTKEIVGSLTTDTDRAKAIFEWVRDNIPHTKDISEEIVTCSSIQTFQEGTGICFPKAHLLASMMRLEKNPLRLLLPSIREHDSQRPRIPSSTRPKRSLPRKHLKMASHRPQR